jgi:hypothetical protein
MELVLYSRTRELRDHVSLPCDTSGPGYLIYALSHKTQSQRCMIRALSVSAYMVCA